MIGDAPLFISHLRRDASASTFLANNPDWVIPFVAAAELLTGVRLARDPTGESARVCQLLDDYPILWPDALTLEHFGDISVELRKAGTPVGVHDRWIAALAREYDVEVVSKDIDLRRISGIRVIDWRQNPP